MNFSKAKKLFFASNSVHWKLWSRHVDVDTERSMDQLILPIHTVEDTGDGMLDFA